MERDEVGAASVGHLPLKTREKLGIAIRMMHRIAQAPG
jgi:hypothetical protein